MFRWLRKALLKRKFEELLLRRQELLDEQEQSREREIELAKRLDEDFSSGSIDQFKFFRQRVREMWVDIAIVEKKLEKFGWEPVER